MQEIAFESISDLQWQCTTSHHMIFAGRYTGLPVLLKSPRDDLPAEAFETTVRHMRILYQLKKKRTGACCT